MARLPVPGQDDNTWGTILNSYLEVSFNGDGTIQTAALTQAGGALDSSVVHTTGTESIAGVKTFTSSPTIPTPTNTTDAANKSYVDNVASSGAPNASSSTAGLVELTGDFSGAYNSPTVVSTHLASALPVNQGGTGSTSQNFVDLSSTQAIGGAKTFTVAPVVPSNSFAESAVTNLTSDLASKANTTDMIAFALAL